jgi:hypothetical protein
MAWQRPPSSYKQGDEHFSWLTDKEGFTVIKDREGFYVYADKGNDGRLKASARRVGFSNPNSLNLKKNLKPDKDKLLDDALKSNEKPSMKAYELWKQSSPRKAENTTGLLLLTERANVNYGLSQLHCFVITPEHHQVLVL